MFFLSYGPLERFPEKSVARLTFSGIFSWLVKSRSNLTPFSLLSPQRLVLADFLLISLCLHLKLCQALKRAKDRHGFGISFQDLILSWLLWCLLSWFQFHV